jgi:hypothetical protein
MMRIPTYRPAFGVLPLLIGIAICACGEVTVPIEAEPLGFEVLDVRARGGFGSDRHRVVITDPAAFRAFWRLVAFPEGTPAPAIDFTQHTIVGASMGGRGSTGYHINVADVLRHDATLYVVIEELSPGPQCLTGAANTWPMTAALISAAMSDVEFVEREHINDC